jgi:LytR cell envelope-related transcriptional attenuator
MSEPSEQPRRRRRQPPPPTAPGQGSVARGAVLVAVAVVIGVLLLRDEDSATTQVAVGSDTAADVDSGTGIDAEDGADADATTTTTQPLRNPAEVKVLVANGSGVDGAAGGATDELEALGYVTATPANAERVPATIVYYTTGFQAEAEALAAAIGAPPESVTQMLAVAPVDDLQLANVLVHLGPDLAPAG